MVQLPIQFIPIFCPSGCRTKSVRRGFYSRADGSRHQRYQCGSCARSFCEGVHLDTYREKRRDLRRQIFLHLTSGYTLRRLARFLIAHRTTVTRKFIRLARLARVQHHADNLAELKGSVTELQFDEMETFEHTKCKPLSIILAVEAGTRRILGFRVSQMPPKGKLAAVARAKYGQRADHRRKARRTLFSELKTLLAPNAVIKSDMNPHYPPDVSEYFPKHEHQVSKGRRGCVVGQGELKRGGFDPLFSLNHTCAMARANMSRLFRRTWNTTKDPERLADHFALYSLFHNRYLIKFPSR